MCSQMCGGWTTSKELGDLKHKFCAEREIDRPVEFGVGVVAVGAGLRVPGRTERDAELAAETDVAGDEVLEAAAGVEDEAGAVIVGGTREDRGDTDGDLGIGN